MCCGIVYEKAVTTYLKKAQAHCIAFPQKTYNVQIYEHIETKVILIVENQKIFT